MGNYDLLRPTGVLSDTPPVTDQVEPVVDTSSLGKDSMNWKEKAEAFQQALYPSSLEKYANELGVSRESLRRLGMGFNNPDSYTFPMRWADGYVCGIRARKFTGTTREKVTMHGGKPGLFLPDGVRPGPDILICEGESDTAAALTLGLDAIGVPSAGQGICEVINFFRTRTASLPCIIGDNDKKGRGGVKATAEALRIEGIPCRILYPPTDGHDLRDWIQSEQLTSSMLQAAINSTPVRFPEGAPRGFHRTPHFLLRAGIIKEVGPVAWAIFCIIASHADQHGKAHPSQKTIADLLGMSVKTVSRNLKELKDAGILSGKSGRPGWSNEYTLHTDAFIGVPKRQPKSRKTLDVGFGSGDNTHHAQEEDHD